ncbi:MAG: hypothetical protein ACE3L7_33710 [Candidatus Pristimantibacillus sp.]
MGNSIEKGHVEFRQPLVTLVAEMPEDEEMREHLKEWKENDGFQGSCDVTGNAVTESEEEQN